MILTFKIKNYRQQNIKQTKQQQSEMNFIWLDIKTKIKPNQAKLSLFLLVGCKYVKYHVTPKHNKLVVLTIYIMNSLVHWSQHVDKYL